MKHRLLALAAAGALCLSLCGFSGEQPLPDTITVQGTGLVEARPDQTEFSAGVRVTSPTAAAAVAAGSEQAAAVRQALENAGVPAENITTEAVWLRAQYTYTNAARIRDGFEYRMEFSVQVPEGVEAGAALDAAIAGGANSTGSLQQTMADADALYNEALGAAVESARQSAEQLAAASGKKLGGERRSGRRERPQQPRHRRWSRAYGGGRAGYGDPGRHPGDPGSGPGRL